MRNLPTLLIFSLILAALGGCGSSVPILKPYKLDIQQGNVVTSKMLLQLKPGMSKSQVRFIMGTPLIVDSFHKDRWDYFYQMRQGGKIIEQRRVILDFEKELLSKVRGDVVPQGTAGAVSGEIVGSKSTAEILKEKENPSLLDKLQFWKTDKKPASQPLEAPKPVVAAPAAALPEASKVPEKGLLDKLKFWKNDEVPDAKATSATKPLEAPKAAMPAPTAPTNEEVPSVLAVPIGAGAGADAPQVETTPIELPSAEPATPEPVKVAPAPVKPAPVKMAPPKAVEPKAVPAKPALNKPAQPMSTNKQDDKKIFRMDKTLDLKQLEPQAAPTAIEPAIEQPAPEKPAAEVLKPKKKADEAPLPSEAEPGFFDRMLEKIGF